MIFTPAMQAAINSREFGFEWYLWIEAKNRDTGALEAAGIHTGAGRSTVNVGGQVRSYEGAGQFIDLGALKSKQGLLIADQDISLNILSPEITNMIRAYDSDLAPTELHLAVFDKDRNLAGMAIAVDGFINGIDINEDKEQATCTITVSTNIQEATKTLTLTKSNESQKLIDPTDEGFKYATTAGTTELKWGVGEGRQIRELARR